MGRQVTLGGERLGTGNKMKVDLHGFERSNHDQSYAWRSTMAMGTLVPFLCEIGTSGTDFEINLDLSVLTAPTLGPMFGSAKVQLDIFSIPIRLYNKRTHNNELGIGLEMEKIKFPQVELHGMNIRQTLIDAGVPPEFQQINQSALLAYIGSRGVRKDITEGTAQGHYRQHHNALPLLMYWDIFKNYYANKQEEKANIS